MPRRFARENFTSGRRRRPISSPMLKVPIVVIIITITIMIKSDNNDFKYSCTFCLSFDWIEYPPPPPPPPQGGNNL